jgi:phage terminase large subunit-like protein
MQYARAVQDGSEPVGPFIKLAVDRFFDWIQRADQLGYFLDHASGMHIILFFEQFLVHTKGIKEGQPFELSPYQKFTLYNIFGWKKRDPQGNPVRVIKTIYEKVARKNGKTAMLAGVGLYCLAFDNAAGPEIYVGATKEAQAKILWEQAKHFVFKSLPLRKIGIKNTQREIRFDRMLGVFRFLGGDSNTLDGLNPSLAIIDEYHSHKTDGVREVLESAMGARREPLFYIITTAGFNKQSVCKQYEDVCKEILMGRKQDDSTFIMIHEPADDADWEDPTTWKLANPNLGHGVNLEYIRSEYKKAINQPSKIPNFKTKHCNQWVDAAEVWIPDNIWKQNQVDPFPVEKFKSLGSYMAVDLSTTKDITAVVLVSLPDDDGNRYVWPTFFCPADTIDQRSKADRVPYQFWADQGHMIATPGNTVDYQAVKDHIASQYHKHGVVRVEMDPWNAHQISQDLMEIGVEVSFFSQQISHISHPTKQWERLVLEGKLKHDGNPVMAWMLGGCVIYQDANENIKVHKGHSHREGAKRVDGVIAGIMALGGSLEVESNENKSAYNDESEIFV